MRQGQQNRRSRSRGGRKPQNLLSRTYESNGPDVKIRGSASHIAEKYMSLARDAASGGDHIVAENLLQHAEHYNRIIMSAQAQVSAQPAEKSDGANGAVVNVNPEDGSVSAALDNKDGHSDAGQQQAKDGGGFKKSSSADNKSDKRKQSRGRNAGASANNNRRRRRHNGVQSSRARGANGDSGVTGNSQKNENTEVSKETVISAPATDEVKQKNIPADDAGTSPSSDVIV
jgi:hypothetical protein